MNDRLLGVYRFACLKEKSLALRKRRTKENPVQISLQRRTKKGEMEKEKKTDTTGGFN